MNRFLPLLVLAALPLSGCMVRYQDTTPIAPGAPAADTPTQERLVQPGPASAPGYWGALDNVPGARTGESDYYYSHGGSGRSF